MQINKKIGTFVILIPRPCPYSVKKFGESETLPCLQTRKFACHNSMEGGRRHETPESERKYIISCSHGSILEKAMATHSSTLAWKLAWTEAPGGLQSMWSLRVGHDWVTSLSLFTFMHWRGKWQPTPVFLPRESEGRRSLVCCHLRCRTESDTTKVT